MLNLPVFQLVSDTQPGLCHRQLDVVSQEECGRCIATVLESLIQCKDTDLCHLALVAGSQSSDQFPFGHEFVHPGCSQEAGAMRK